MYLPYSFGAYGTVSNGDIIINNPVGNAYDLAQELITNLPNAINRQTHKS